MNLKTTTIIINRRPGVLYQHHRTLTINRGEEPVVLPIFVSPKPCSSVQGQGVGSVGEVVPCNNGNSPRLWLSPTTEELVVIHQKLLGVMGSSES